MYKTVVEFEDFNEETRTKTVYFALNEAQFLELQAKLGGHLTERIERIREEKDESSLISLIKELMRAAYGEKSDDGLRMDKSEEAWLRFYQSNAYSAALMQILTVDTETAAFLNGILPKQIREKVDVNDALAKARAAN